MTPPSFDPAPTIAELKELRALTGDENGAQRVAFTPIWRTARAWLQQKIDAIPGIESHRDQAGNLWATLPGQSERALVIGGHIDSVPNGGWLDGCLGTLAALAILRHLATTYPDGPPVTIRLVDWADEEGARFGKSLFGSSACSGNLNLAEAATLKDKDGITLPDALRAEGIDFDHVKACGIELANAAAYQELHIEQGPVLLDLDLPLGTVLGTYGVERHAIHFHGQAAHSGSTPMNRRKDAFLAAARMAPEAYAITDREGGVCTIGSCKTQPGIVTSVVEDCEITLDQRHLDPTALARMLAQAKDASERFATEAKATVTWQRLWHIPPAPVHPDLIALCDQAIQETTNTTHRLPSGPLHDAAEVAMAGIPTIMMFVQSLHGISHNKIEDTKEDHLHQALTAFTHLATKIIPWITKPTLQ
jgi:N-carbamoyl-L-amino-acid hydrolase